MTKRPFRSSGRTGPESAFHGAMMGGAVVFAFILLLGTVGITLDFIICPIFENQEYFCE